MPPPAFLHPFAPPAAEAFLSIVAGDGAVVVDDAGRRYIDAMASLWYCNVGHGRAEIADAIAEQARTLAGFHTFSTFTNPPAEALTEAVAALAPTAGSRVFLTSSGSEAVDSALKLARIAHALAGNPQKRVVVSRAPSYHGVTYGGLSCTGLPANREGFGALLPDVVQVGKDDLHAVAEVFDRRAGEVAAVIAEPVVGAAGVYPPAAGYLEGLRRLCDEHGAWLILDEVISGFGRLGHWWGAERYGVRPDLQTFAKAVTSGYQPLGGVLVAPPVLQALEADPAFVLRHGHTYSGHPAACAAGVANLRILRREALIQRAPKIGQRLADGLRALVDEGLVAEARGDGAVWAAGLHEGDDALSVHDAMLRRGVIARPIPPATITFCPPLVAADDQVDACVDALAGALREVGGGARRSAPHDAGKAG